MIVSELKALLENCPDGSPIVIAGEDHSYVEVEVVLTTALLEEGTFEGMRKGYRVHITEDHGEQMTPEAEYGERFNVVLVGR